MCDQVLKRTKEEQLVANDGTAEGATKLIGLVRRLRLREEVASIERVISKEVKRAAVKRVAPRLNCEVDNRSAEGSVFRIRVAGFHLERVYRVQWRCDADEGIQRFRIVNAVHHVVVARPWKSVNNSLRWRQSARGGRVLGEIAPARLNRARHDGDKLFEEPAT